jgi:hypothetical protein
MKRSLAEEIFESYSPVNTEEVKRAFNGKFAELGFIGVSVSEVDADEEGNTFVTFQDDEDNFLDIVFMYDDEEEGVIAIAAGDEEDEWATVIELNSVEPALDQTAYGTYVNLTNLSWLNSSGLEAILMGGDLDYNSLDGQDDNGRVKGTTFQQGNVTYYENLNKIEERKVAVIRGGKKVRLAVVRKKRKKLLTGRQKSSIRAAVRKRKMKKNTIKRKRAKSLRIRRRMGIKTPKLNRNQKIAGGANKKLGSAR